MDLITNCLFVGAGGMLGAIARYLIGLIPLRPENGFPLTTMMINAIGAFCIGLIAVSASAHAGAVDTRLLVFLKVGICGGFTTFSTFSLELFDLIDAGSLAMAALYAAGSVLICVGAVGAAQLLLR
jgi:crcB protein